MIEQKPKKRRRPNRSEKQSLRAADIAIFVRQYGRKAQKGVEPNDRKFNEDVERLVKRMDPVMLDRWMREDEVSDEADL